MASANGGEFVQYSYRNKVCRSVTNGGEIVDRYNYGYPLSALGQDDLPPTVLAGPLIFLTKY